MGKRRERVDGGGMSGGEEKREGGWRRNVRWGREERGWMEEECPVEKRRERVDGGGMSGEKRRERVDGGGMSGGEEKREGGWRRNVRWGREERGWMKEWIWEERGWMEEECPVRREEKG